MSFSSCFGQQGYAVFDSSTGTLTFQYGTPTGTLNTDYYNTDNIGAGYPGWWYGITSSIKKVVFDSSFANARPNSCHLWFANCTNLTVIDGIEYLNTSDVTNMSDMFYKCSGLTSLDVTHFNTEKVTTMQLMFWGCSGLTSLDVTHFNTANVTHMRSMFQTCRSLTSLDVSNFNTEKVTDMRWMFTDCSGLISLDLSKFNTEEVTNMECMFDGCSGLTSLDVSHFNTAKVTTMEAMFKGCSGLTSLDVTHFNTANVTNMRIMFYQCSGLTKLDVSNFNTANVTTMNGMFNGCSGLTKLDVSNFNTANVTDMDCMFGRCSGLTSLDLSHFNTANVIDMGSMFWDCSGLTSLDLSNFNTEKGYYMAKMFMNCSGLTSLTFGENFTTASCTDGHCMLYMFSGCSRLRYLDFYASSDDISNGFSNANINRTTNNADALFGSTNNGLPMTTVVYMPHNIRRSDYSDYSGLPNLVFNEPENGGLIANQYYSVDKVDVEFPRAFKANTAQYTRTMNIATQYGTAILPYAFTSNDDVQAYTLDAEHTETMYFVEAETVQAHTPFFYKKKNPAATSVSFMITDENPSDSNYEIAVEATHTTSAAEDGEPYETGSGMDGWETRGYYVLETITANNNGTFYISGDKFLKAMGTVKMNPHRVTFHGEWLKGSPSTSEGANYMDFVMMEAPAETEEPTETQEPVVDENLPEEVITALEAADLRKEASEASAIYDAQGRTRQTLQKGLNLIRKQDGTVKKVFLK